MEKDKITVNSSKRKPVVAHSVTPWLPLTMMWIYNKLRYAETFSSIVLTNTVENMDQFSWDPVYAIRGKGLLASYRILRRFGILSYPRIYDEAISKHCPVILHSHFANRGWYDLPLAKKKNLKHVVTFYGYDVSMLPSQQPVWRNRYKKLFEKADLFLCEGPHMAQCVAELGCPREKLKVQRLGVEIDKIPFVPRKIGEDGLIKILIAGTFREKKGIPYALEAIGLLKEQYPHLAVTVIGDSTGQTRENEEKIKILNILKKYNLEPITKMLGFQPHHVLIEEAYKHHIFLSPSITASDGDTEGGAPVTIIEMAASGMPIVSTKHCDIPEIVKDQETGLLSEERDAKSLEKQLVKLIYEPELLSQFGYAGRLHVENHYNVKNTVHNLEALYYGLLE